MDLKETPLQKLREISTAYWKSQALFTALRLGIFKQMGGGTIPARQLAGEIGTDADATERLLVSLVALGLLKQDQSGFSVLEELRPYLAEGGDKDFSGAIAHMDHLQANWQMLEESVRTGRPGAFRTDIPESELQEKTERFMEAMESIASTVAQALVREVKVRGDEEVFDIGCGPGTYFRSFLRTHPKMRAAALDTDDVIPIARRNAEREGLLGRVTFVPGDFNELPFEERRFDLVLLSNVMHIYSEDDVSRIFSKIYSTLRPGGRFLLNDFFTDETGTRPLWGALFCLNMLLNTQGGRNYRLQQGEDFLRKAGFSEILSHRLTIESTLLIGNKPS